MKHILILAAFFISNSIVAQNNRLAPCGTQNVKSDWLINYQKNPAVYDKRSGEVLWVPMSVTLIGYDNGSGFISERTVHESMCTLNSDFSDSEIQFYLAEPIRYIKNSAYADHQTVLQGAQMMFDNNYPDMINCYIMDNAAGNCGYNLPYAGIALSSNCTQSSDHTWAHEVGHNLSLPHPFLGWEGGISHDGSVGHSFNDPAPERVTYDYTLFQDTLILDTIIIDTAFVEKLDGSNCAYAADGFCDTQPDYLAIRWACNDATGISSDVQMDPNGETFQSDGSIIMSYASDNCANRFTPEQIAAMRANLIDEKPNHLGNANPLDEIVDTEVEVLTPEFLAEVYFKDVYIEWEPVENATAYTIQITRTASYGLTVFDSLVYGNSIVIPEMIFKSHKHYFRVKALNEYDFCSEFIAFGGFETTEQQTSTEERILSKIKVRPTMLMQSDQLFIENEENSSYTINISNLIGQSVYKTESSSRLLSINTEDFEPGVYLVSLQKGIKAITTKIVITN